MGTPSLAALVRFCLAAVMTVAGTLCLCAAGVKAERAPTPDIHSCCGEVSDEGDSPLRPSDHAERGACGHCCEQPDIAPAAGDKPAGSLAPVAQVPVIPSQVRPLAAPHAALRGNDRALSPAGPQTLRTVGTVVLLL